MTVLQQRRADPMPTPGEGTFRLNEVFYSRADGRGTVRAVNHVFCRVAGMAWDEMVGANHRTVRHPDMPEGVYHLLWAAIRRGEPVGAYILNRSRGGIDFWSFAMVVPCDDAFLSIRIKPPSEILAKVAPLYAEQRRLETGESLGPEASAAWLQQRLQEQGHPDYGRFMAHALSEELIVRDRLLQRAEDAGIARFRAMLDAAARLAEETDRLVREFEATAVIPHNMRVIASRLEPNGGPISTLSTNYGGMSREMSGWFETHVLGQDSNFARIRGTVANAMYLQCMVRILGECAHQLDFERGRVPELDTNAERAHLARLIERYGGRRRAEQARVAEETGRIVDACRKMQRHMLGLSTTRMMCKIESARLTTGRESLTDIIGELSGCQQRIRTCLAAIEAQSAAIRALLT